MAKPKKSYVPNVATVKISNPAWHIFVPRSTTPSLPSRILTEMQFPGQAPAFQGFKGSRKSTPFAAQMAAESAAKAAMEHGMKSVEVMVKGPGASAKQPSVPFKLQGLKLTLLKT